jgi:ribosomal protein S12 methylthiotransferase accessory factor
LLTDALDRLLDPRFGVINQLGESPQEPGMPQFFHYFANATRTAALGGQPGFELGGGASVDRDQAMAKAIGEVVERYCVAFFSQESLPLVSANEAPFPHADPAAFALYREDQYATGRLEFVPFTNDLPVRWTRAIDIETAGEIYVPAAAVHLPYMYEGPEEGAIMQPISTGLACNEGYESALISAACEAIERDAFTIFWQAKLPPPRVPLASLDANNADLLDRFARARFEVTVFNVTTDVGVPSVMAVACHDDASQPALSVAAATHPVANVAVRKCLEELEHTRFWSRRLKASTPPVDPERTDEIYGQEEHLRFWCEQSNRHLADWLFTSEIENELPKIAFADERSPGELLEYTRTSLKMAGLQLLCADVTTPEIRELGLNVVRAVVPGLHPLVIGHVRRALGGRRLYDVPARLGYGPPNLPLHDPTNPHPFP